jgi:hypothetical protein
MIGPKKERRQRKCETTHAESKQMAERILAHKSNEGSRTNPLSTLVLAPVRITAMSTKKRLYEPQITI